MKSEKSKLKENLLNSDTKQVTLPLKLYELHKDTYRTRHQPLFCYFTTTYIHSARNFQNSSKKYEPFLLYKSAKI